MSYPLAYTLSKRKDHSMEKEKFILSIEETVRKYPVADPTPLKRAFYDLTKNYDLVQVEIRRYEEITSDRCLVRYYEDYPNRTDRYGHILKWEGWKSDYRPRKPTSPQKKEIRVVSLAIHINLDNDAFVKDQLGEMKRIFAELGNKVTDPMILEAKKDGFPFEDSNGKAGRMRIITDERRPDL